MQILQIDIRNAELETTSSKLIIRSNAERRATVPLKTIDRLVLTSSARLPASLLAMMAAQGRGILIAGAGFSRQTPVHIVASSGDAALRMAQYRTFCDPARRNRIASRFVVAKLTGQSGLNAEWAQKGRGDHKRLAETSIRLAQVADHLQRERPVTGDTSIAASTQTRLPHRNPERLFGIEGAAAAAHFAAMQTVFAPALGFSGRNRQPPRDPVNACLSLAYTLAHHEALIALAMRGFDATIGFLHEPLADRDSLACDMNEPLRPLADRFVHELFHHHGLRVEHFSTSAKSCLMGKAGRRLFYEAYAEHLAPRLAVTAREQALWLKAELTGNEPQSLAEIRHLREEGQ